MNRCTGVRLGCGVCFWGCSTRQAVPRPLHHPSCGSVSSDRGREGASPGELTGLSPPPQPQLTVIMGVSQLELAPLDANSWQRGRSRSLGQVAARVAVCRRRPRSTALLYLSAVTTLAVIVRTRG